MQNPKIIPRKDEATAVEERLVLYYFLLFRVSLTLRDPDRGHFDPHGDVRRSSSWRVARFILAFDQRNYSLLGRSRTEEVSFRGRMLCFLLVTTNPSSLADISFVFRTFFQGGGRKGGGEDHAWRNFLLRARLIRRSSTPSVLLPLTSAPRCRFV